MTVVNSDDSIFCFLLSAVEDQQLEILFNKLNKLNLFTLFLQCDKIIMATVRYIFDEAIIEFPGTKKRVSSLESIIYDRHFESGLVKLQQGY